MADKQLAPRSPVVEILRKKTPSEKLSQAFAMWDFAMVIMRSSIRRDHPDWSNEEVQREIFRRVRRRTAP
ncbi:MAG: hypothetical protein C0478_06235 [Planctomyces sp.]|nr:hypothetical protein [Planctomyces sp.]